MSISECTESTESEFTESEFTEDMSIYNDIDELIHKCENLHTHIEASFKTMESIQQFITQNNETTGIYITYNNCKCDFIEVINRIHNESTENIRNGQPITFGKSLLTILETVTF